MHLLFSVSRRNLLSDTAGHLARPYNASDPIPKDTILFVFLCITAFSSLFKSNESNGLCAILVVDTADPS